MRKRPAQDARRDTSQIAWTPNSWSCTDKYKQNDVKIPVLESILEKTVGYVLSESNQLRKKLNVHHYTGCIIT